MKGLVFTEFLAMVESAHGMDTTDQLLEIPSLPSRGVYTSVGTYDAGELVQMVVLLADILDSPIDDLLAAFGEHLFERFHTLFPAMFVGDASCFEFLASIHDHIHVEVRKLYPEADLPHFTAEFDKDGLNLIYTSKHPFAMFGLGLIRGCLQHYGGIHTVEYEMLEPGDGSKAIFRIR
ncbi:MAG: hypothetical protein ACI9F9_002005 [Candidatus Paceibacteria bacterium]|jgi:hypothetical protein